MTAPPTEPAEPTVICIGLRRWLRLTADQRRTIRRGITPWAERPEEKLAILGPFASPADAQRVLARCRGLDALEDPAAWHQVRRPSLAEVFSRPTELLFVSLPSEVWRERGPRIRASLMDPWPDYTLRWNRSAVSGRVVAGSFRVDGAVHQVLLEFVHILSLPLRFDEGAHVP